MSLSKAKWRLLSSVENVLCFTNSQHVFLSLFIWILYHKDIDLTFWNLTCKWLDSSATFFFFHPISQSIFLCLLHRSRSLKGQKCNAWKQSQREVACNFPQIITSAACVSLSILALACAKPLTWVCKWSWVQKCKSRSQAEDVGKIGLYLNSMDASPHASTTQRKDG